MKKIFMPRYLMYIKIGDLKLLKIKVIENGEVVYTGMVEDAPDNIKETNYKSAIFESEFVVIEI